MDFYMRLQEEFKAVISYFSQEMWNGHIYLCLCLYKCVSLSV